MDKIVNTVRSAHGILASHVLDRNHVEAYWLAAYLMRWLGNLPLGMSLDVSEFAERGSRRFKEELSIGK